MKGAVLFGWFFLASAVPGNCFNLSMCPPETWTIVGPFATRDDCEQVRAFAAAGRSRHTSWCWWDGK